MNSTNSSPYSNDTTLKTSNQILDTRTDIYILSLVVSDFSHQYNELFKQQKEETIKAFKECCEKLKCTTENQKKVNADCKAKLKVIREIYKDARKQIKDKFKEFRETTESLIKGAEKLKLIDKEDVKDFKKKLRTFKKETRNAEKNFKNEPKSGSRIMLGQDMT